MYLLIEFWQKWQLAILINSSVLLLLWPFYFLVKHLILKILSKANDEYIKFLKKHGIFKYLLYSLIGFYCIFWINIIDNIYTLPKIIVRVFFITSHVYVVVISAILFLIFSSAAGDIYRTKEISKRIPIKPYIQTLKIIIILYAIIGTISYIMDISPNTILASLGAVAAVLTFVFKDTILGFVSSMQLALQDIVRIGDWITVPSYGVDGDVEEINIVTVKIRNFDRTISTIPTQALLSVGIKNWRGMVESGGRRIKRSILIDIDTIKFCSKELLEQLRTLNYIEEILKSENLDEITNVKLFRLFINSYLENNKLINNQKFTFLIRQLEPSEKGLPIELYIFTASTNWVEYEDIQSNIFEHLFAILHRFELRAFQSFAKKIKISN